MHRTSKLLDNETKPSLQLLLGENLNIYVAHLQLFFEALNGIMQIET